jgi:pyridoxal phosphate enzyme (YggS family)
MGVTKRVDAARIREAVDLGLADIGENRVAEAEEKLPLLADMDVRCHLIGHLQSNKARRALDVFASIRSLDSVALARRLDGMLSAPFPVWVQVQAAAGPGRSGVPVSGLGSLVDEVRAARYLRLGGFMTIPPFFDDPRKARPFFRRVRELGQRYDVRELSMGMSHDFEIAIEEGSTEVRIGTALFGERS